MDIDILDYRYFGQKRPKMIRKSSFLLHMSEKSIIFAANFDAKEVIMTALQLNADIYRNLGIIAEDETMLDKAAKYLRRLVKQMTNDPTCMSKEEYFAMLDRSEQGPTVYTAKSVEELDKYIRSLV